MSAHLKHYQCCIVGGGPAGMMLGLLLARAGVSVVVLEKHGDFLRDFRGDTVHPSTSELMHELGILEAFLKRPHQKAESLGGYVGEEFIKVGDLTHLPTQCKYMILMPQWDFLDFLATHAQTFPTFELRLQHEVTGLLKEGPKVVGVRGQSPQGEFEVVSDLVIGTDGRHSLVREAAGLTVEKLGAPIDVLWMRLSRKAGDPEIPFGRFQAGQIFIMLYRGDYWQCGMVIPKGSYQQIQSAGLEAFRERVAKASPTVADRVSEIRSWDDAKLLTVEVDHLRQWYGDGVLCIGDAAHAMSPIGGVGINLAVQDAVATANLLWERLAQGAVTLSSLKRVQERREFPTRITQKIQILAQDRILSRVLTSTTSSRKAPFPVSLFKRFPILARIPGRLIGHGVRPEHVQSPLRA